jgi:hypothetical protein
MSVISARRSGVGLALEIDRDELHQWLAAHDANRVAGSGSRDQFIKMCLGLSYDHLLS